MSILSRIIDLFQAKTHKLLTAMENPAETLDLSYEKMIAGLQQTKRHLADVTTERTALERQIASAEAEVVQAESDARTALQSSREDLARAALRHKQLALQTLETLRQAHASLAPQVEKLIGYQRALQDRIERFRTEKEVMKGSYAAAQAQVRITESMTGIGSDLGGVGATLQRAQERVQHAQDRADTLAGLLEQGVLSDPLDPRSETDKELRALRASSAIEADMDRLRLELGVATPRPVPLLENRPDEPRPS